MIHRGKTEEEETVEAKTAEQRIIEHRSSVVGEKVAAAHEALERFLRGEDNPNGAR